MRRVRVKPSKPVSFSGFVMGIIFIFIGIVFVIPTAGGFGIFWTFIAVVITAMHGMNAFGSKGFASYEIETDALDQTQSEHNDFAKRLRDLEKLKNDGLITRDEYELKRQEILNDKW